MNHSGIKIISLDTDGHESRHKDKLINNDGVAIDKTGEIIKEEITTCLSVAYFWCIGLLESGVDHKI